MKIRNGFVSNSSSSSFILRKGEQFKNVMDLAIHMLSATGRQKLIDMINKSDKDPNINVAFHSCNYDTFIALVDDLFLIYTCNNEDWDLDSEVSYKEVRETHPELVDNYYELDDDIRKEFKFWFLDYDLMMSESKVYNWCKKHSTDNFVINGKDMCPLCYKEKHLERIEKLKRIIK